MQRFMLAYTLGNFQRRLTRPKAVMEWSLRSVPLKLVKTGARLVRHARRLVFQMAAVAVPRDVWMAILERIGGLRLVPG
jgi:Transposase DDE domain group 1